MSSDLQNVFFGLSLQMLWKILFEFVNVDEKKEGLAWADNIT